MSNIKIIGDTVSTPLGDVMRTSIYDINNVGIVDRASVADNATQLGGIDAGAYAQKCDIPTGVLRKTQITLAELQLMLSNYDNHIGKIIQIVCNAVDLLTKMRRGDGLVVY